jgi:hypothetical protein
MAGLLDNYANKLVDSMTGGQESSDIKLAREQLLRRMQAESGMVNPDDMLNLEDQAMRNLVLQRMQNSSGMYNPQDMNAMRAGLPNLMIDQELYRPETGSYISPRNTMQNIDPRVGGMSAGNTQRPIDLNSLLRMLGR